MANGTNRRLSDDSKSCFNFFALRDGLGLLDKHGKRRKESKVLSDKLCIRLGGCTSGERIRRAIDGLRYKQGEKGMGEIAMLVSLLCAMAVMFMEQYFPLHL